jgi:polyisoprenoid-binding protein YceI
MFAVTVEATGELTIHGVTQQVTLPLEAQLVDRTIVGGESRQLARELSADAQDRVPTWNHDCC